jgi:hypothetical protein
MFLETQEPISLAEAGLHGLCASLNTPVVNIESMPVGPARAAIVVFADDRGGLGLAVGLRSLENGQVMVFMLQSELDPMAGAASTMDGALSFAEGMGFLFDDDLVATGGPAGRTRALRHWQELVGDLAEDGGAQSSSEGRLASWTDEGREVDGAGEELLLDEFLLEDSPVEDGAVALDAPDLEFDAAELAEDALVENTLSENSLEWDEAETGLPQVDAEPEETTGSEFETVVQVEQPAAPPQLLLSKFRRIANPPDAKPRAVATRAPIAPNAPIAAATAAAVGTSPASQPVAMAEGSGASKPVLGGAALGRIPIVKLRKEGRAGRPGPLAKLLGSF